MFKYTKRLLSDIHFWCKEWKIRSNENAEWEEIEQEAESGLRHHMAGYACYASIKRNRATRKEQHLLERAKIQ